MDQLRLPDEFFLLAHDPGGKAAVHETSIAAALAGALLIDLLHAGRITTADGRLIVVDPSPTGDAAADAVLRASAHAPGPLPLKPVLVQMAGVVYANIADRLIATGLIRRKTHKRLGLVAVTRLPVVDEAVQRRIRIRIWYAVQTDTPQRRDGALCALLQVTRLDVPVFAAMPFPQTPDRLDRIVAGLNGGVRDVVAAVTSLLADQATTINR